MKYLAIILAVIALQGCITVRITTVETVNIIGGEIIEEETAGGFSI